MAISVISPGAIPYAANEESQSSGMSKFVSWMKNSNDPALLKVAVVACAAAALVGIAFLTPYPLFVTLVVAIPTAIWGLKELNILNSKEKEAHERAENVRRLEVQQQSALQAIREAVGGEEAFRQLPVLDIGDRIGATGYLDFLRVDDLSHSVMSGIDSAGRAFISLKLRPLRPEDGNQPFVITLFQRYSQGGLWTWGGNPPRGSDLFDNIIRDEDRATLRQLVVTRNHPQFALV